MEIPDINMITDFGAGMNCLQNPSLISRFFSFPGIEKVPHMYKFWKWGALLFAILATFSSIIKRIKLILIRFHSVKSYSNLNEQITDFSEDDDDDVSLVSSDDEYETEEADLDRPTTTSFGGDEDFCVKGLRFCFKNQGQNGNLRQRLRRNVSGSWSEFTSGKNVVKLWDSLGLSLDFDEDLINKDYENVVSMWDFDLDRKRGEYSGDVWDMPAVVLTAEGKRNGDAVVFGGYDKRMPRGVPAMWAEWKSPAEAVGGMAVGGVGEVYVRDDASRVVTVGDVRNMKMPLECVRETDGETWWDADAVIEEEEEF